MLDNNGTSPRSMMVGSRINKIEMLRQEGFEEIPQTQIQKNSESVVPLASEVEIQTNSESVVPLASEVDFIKKGNITVRVMDRHNFYEAEMMNEEYLKDAPIGLLTKIWISISKSLK